MPYVTETVTRTGTESYTYYQTQSRSVYTGFDDVTIARPKFIYFKVAGLRPNERHFFFFDSINISNYINTDSVTIDEFYSLSKNDPKRNPGEKYVTETGFPTDLGGPTSEIFSDDTGTIEGIFYLQSNDSLSFPAGTRDFTVLDISKFSPNESTSVASQQFTSDGGIENYAIEYYQVKKTGYKTVTWTEEVQVYVEPTYVPFFEAPVFSATETFATQFDTKPPSFTAVTFTAEDPPSFTAPAQEDGGASSNDDPIDDGLLGNKDGDVVDEAIGGAIVGAVVAGVVGSSIVGGGIVGAVVGIVAAICCFIMLEARYGNGVMDKVVRRYRDEKMTERNRRGYYKVAEVLVPMMRKSNMFKWVVTKTFADPLVSYGKWYYGENKYGWIFKPVEKFWMSVFDTVGGEVQFIRENGEVV